MPEIHNDKGPLKDFIEEVNQNSTDHTGRFAVEDIEENRGLAAVCYIPILFVLAYILRPKSPYIRFHVNQGIDLLILSVVLGIVRGACGFIPIVYNLLALCTGLITFLFFLYGFINTVNGKAKELPFIGKIKFIHE